jgi:hypothetical protein
MRLVGVVGLGLAMAVAGSAVGCSDDGGDGSVDGAAARADAGDAAAAEVPGPAGSGGNGGSGSVDTGTPAGPDAADAADVIDGSPSGDSGTDAVGDGGDAAADGAAVDLPGPLPATGCEPAPLPPIAPSPPPALCQFSPPQVSTGPYPADIIDLVTNTTLIVIGEVVAAAPASAPDDAKITIRWDEALGSVVPTQADLVLSSALADATLVPGQRRIFFGSLGVERLTRVLPLPAGRAFREDVARIRDYLQLRPRYDQLVTAKRVVRGKVTEVRVGRGISHGADGLATVQVEDTLCGQGDATITVNIDGAFGLGQPQFPELVGSRVVFALGDFDATIGAFRQVPLLSAVDYKWSAADTWPQWQRLLHDGLSLSLQEPACHPPISLCTQTRRTNQFEFRGLWASSPSNVWAAGSGTTEQWDGSAWTPHVFSDNAYGVWGSGADHVWSVAEGGSVSPMAPFTAPQFFVGDRALYGIWGTSASDGWVVGAGGVIGHGGAQGWFRTADAVTTNDLRAIHGRDAGDIWAVGDGVVLHFDGHAWSTDASAPSDVDFRGVRASNAGADVWAVGSQSGHGVIYRRNAGGWAKLLSVPVKLNAVFEGAGTIWVTGDQGVVLRQVPGSSGAALADWTRIPTDASVKLLSIWVFDSGELWVGGGEQTLLRKCRED